MTLSWVVRSIDIYVFTAVQGTNFFPAAAEAQQLLSENAMPMIGVNRLGDFIFFLGKFSCSYCDAR